MEFGNISDIENINWKLPLENSATLDFLSRLKLKNADNFFQYYLGAPAWSHKEWVGQIYPLKTKPADYLYYYSRYYQCIELNTSHYRIPSPDVCEKWLAAVDTSFLFCPKVFQDISHKAGGLKNKELNAEWFRFLENLKSHAGPSFLQLPPYFDYSRKSELFYFLQNWPSEFLLALEFRHPSWFKDGQILVALTEYLQSRNIGLVITDVAGRRDVLHSSLSADFSLVRFIGNDLHPSDFSRLALWADKLKNWSSSGLSKVYFFIHEPDDIKTPEMTRHVIEKFQEVLI